MTLIAKPFITIFGDEYWCDQIEKSCIPNLPMEPTEWIRNNGSDFKLVHVDIDARKFNEDEFRNFGNTILDSPLFHLFVIVENDDQYTNTDKNIFHKWISALRSRTIETWKLFVISDDLQNKKFTFNRFSISNKMKSDFNIQKISNHLIKISENPKERYVQIQTILRDLILNIYDDRCFKNEDKIRIQRETRFTPQWNYFEYFSMQEELADIYECLSLYEESLAQFDETNFIFVKCLDGYYKGECSHWINTLKEVSFDVIDCLILTNYSDPQKRYDLSRGKLCLADFRAYLLSRQCALLQLLNKYQEIPALVYSMLISFLNECKLLNLNIDSSLKNSWIFLTSLQALQRFSPIDCENAVAQDYATLFLLALNSVNKLANDWNIWSTKQVDWTKIENLIKKLSVLNHDEFGDTPSSRLAGGLRSREHFQEFHRKLYEEALIILKHIGRIRSANYLGVQFADLCCQINKYEEAEPFYLKAIKCLCNENWTYLAMSLRLKLAKCQKGQFDRDPEKYLKTCAHLAGATFCDNDNYFNIYVSVTNDEEQNIYYNELRNYVEKYVDKFHKSKDFTLEPLFTIKNVKLMLPVNGFQMVELEILSHLPQSTEAKLMLSGKKYKELDYTHLQNGKFEPLNRISFKEEMFEFPAKYAISLSNQSSPRVRKLKDIEPKKKDIYCQSSFEDFHTLNSGISVKRNPYNNESREDDSVLTLVLFPKSDNGLKARRLFITRDILNREIDLISNIAKENGTKFIPIDNHVILKPGKNKMVLKSEKFGLFLPDFIEIFIFNDRLYIKNIIGEHNLDQSCFDMTTLETFLPNFTLEVDDITAFVNFNNELKPKVKLGLLNISNECSVVELCIKNDRCKESYCSENIVVNNDQQFMPYGCDFSLQKPLCYNLDSIHDKIYIRMPGLIKKQFSILSFEKINISENIIRTNSSRYIIKIDLLKSADRNKCDINCIVRSSSLKLHHGSHLCQLLPSVNRSLSTGIFNDRTPFTLIWLVETLDILKLENESLKLTLSLDLLLQVNEKNHRSGSILHEFELNY